MDNKALAPKSEGRKPRLLFLAHTFPHPPDGGVFIRTFNIRRTLSESFDVTTLCFDRKGALAPLAEREADMEAMRRFGPVEVVPLPQDGNRTRAVADHVRSLLGRRVFTYYKHDSAAFERSLRRLLDEEDFDIVHVDSLDLSRFLPLLNGLPVVCTHHNVESKLLRDRASTETGARRAYVLVQASLQEREERRFCPSVALNVAVSDSDRDAIHALAPDSRVETVPNGVDTDLLTPDWSADQHGIVFVGGLGWFPNRNALDWFCEEILPVLRASGGAVPVQWVGRAGESEISRYQQTCGVSLTGYVEDVRPFLRDAACYVIPMRVGGGTRLKLLDAWAMGKAVVSTSQGVEGTKARHGENVWIADSPEAFAAGVQRVLEDNDLRNRLGREGRKTVERLYSWEVIGRRQADLYRSVLDDFNAR